MMVDFSGLKKSIYFPRKEERNQDILVIYVTAPWGKNWIGHTDAGQLLSGKKFFYPLLRCQPYSDELWDRCKALMQRRLILDGDYEKLMTKGLGQHD